MYNVLWTLFATVALITADVGEPNEMNPKSKQGKPIWRICWEKISSVSNNTRGKRKYLFNKLLIPIYFKWNQGRSKNRNRKKKCRKSLGIKLSTVQMMYDKKNGKWKRYLFERIKKWWKKWWKKRWNMNIKKHLYLFVVTSVPISDGCSLMPITDFDIENVLLLYLVPFKVVKNFQPNIGLMIIWWYSS